MACLRGLYQLPPHHGVLAVSVRERAGNWVVHTPRIPNGLSFPRKLFFMFSRGEDSTQCGIIAMTEGEFTWRYRRTSKSCWMQFARHI